MHPLDEIDRFKNHPYIELKQNVKDKLKEISNEWLTADIDTRDFNIENYARANFVGLCGEWAFSKYYNMDFNPVIGEADKGYDYKIKHMPSDEVGTVDIKTITFRNGDLLIRSRREIDVNAYFLMEKRGDLIGLIGTANKEMVKEAQKYPPGEYSPVSVRRIERESLRPVPEPNHIKMDNNKRFKCPECGTIGEHSHPTEGVRSCNKCGYASGEAHFEKVE